MILGASATAETVEAIRRELGLDLPWYERYGEWLFGLLQGDMGKSLANQREISELIGWRLANTLSLAALAAIIAIPLAVTLGILAALYRNSIFDRVINVVTLSSISLPSSSSPTSLSSSSPYYSGYFPAFRTSATIWAFGIACTEACCRPSP